MVDYRFLIKLQYWYLISDRIELGTNNNKSINYTAININYLHVHKNVII